MTVKKKPTAAETLANGLQSQVDRLTREYIAKIGEMQSRISALEASFGDTTAGAMAPPTAADLIATEDSRVGSWMAQQVSEGKTTVDLAMVEHIRTGIRLALGC